LHENKTLNTFLSLIHIWFCFIVKQFLLLHADDGNNEAPHESMCIVENKMWNQGVDATKRCHFIYVNKTTFDQFNDF